MVLKEEEVERPMVRKAEENEDEESDGAPHVHHSTAPQQQRHNTEAVSDSITGSASVHPPLADNAGAITEAVASRRVDSSVAWLQRVARLADTDGNARTSASELLTFAQSLQAKEQDSFAAETLAMVDDDGSGDASIEEIGRHTPLTDVHRHRFRLADFDGNSRLDVHELRCFLYPQLDPRVLTSEADRQLRLADIDGNGAVSMSEFLRASEKLATTLPANRVAGSAAFSEQDAREDFVLYDGDHDGQLNQEELQQLISGVDVLKSRVTEMIQLADLDGDKHIHIDDELPRSLGPLMDSEFVEDYFYHKQLPVSP